MEAYFYVEKGLLVLMQENRLQKAFDNLKELFDHVGLHTNVAKMVSMACQPCRALGVHSAKAYIIRMTEEGENLLGLAPPEILLPLLKHEPGGRVPDVLQTGPARGGPGGAEGPPPPPSSPPHPPYESRTYRISFTQEAQGIACPVGGCLRRETSRRALQVHYVHCLEKDMLVIL